MPALRAAPLLLGLAGGGVAGANEDDAPGRVRAAVTALRLEVFDRCVLTARQEGAVERNGSRQMRAAGTVVFARVGPVVLSDRNVAETDLEPREKSARPTDAERPRETRSEVQEFIAAGGRRVQVRYAAAGGQKRVRSVSCDPRRAVEDDFELIARRPLLHDVLGRCFETDLDLLATVSQPPAQVTRGPPERVAAEYRTEFGRLRVELVAAGGREAVASLRFSQGPTDRYTRRTAATLAGVPESVLGDHPAGLTAVVREVELTYPPPPAALPVAAITASTEYRSASARWRSVERLTLTEYRRIGSEADVHALRLPIPGGRR